jgi:acetate---CoA ligase (ADP-forming)
MTSSVQAMLTARSVAVVGASPREGSFGHRLVSEVTRSLSAPAIHLVNPRHLEVLGRPCLPSLDAIDGPVDLVLLGVPDAVLEAELTRAGARGDRSAVVFGTAYEPPGVGPNLTARLAAVASHAGMALCGGGCMGFVNVTAGLRAIGYLERDPLPGGPIALVTHSGSAFSALLRTHRPLGYTLAVSSGQELVTTTGDYLEVALDDPATRVIALLLETVRAPERLRRALDRATRLGVAVVLLTVGGSPVGSSLVAAHSGAIAGADAAWEALVDAYGLLRVRDLDEMADTLELFAIGRRVSSGGGLATVHDSGAERTLVADVAHDLGVPFASLAPTTKERLATLLEPGLEATNPLDVWGTGADTRPMFAGCLSALADDPDVAAAALCVDLVEEYDGDDSYVLAALDAFGGTAKPIVVLSNIASALDQRAASRLRVAGVPVLEGTRSGLRALGHLLAHGMEPGRRPTTLRVDEARQGHWRSLLAAGPLDTIAAFALIRDYGIATVNADTASSRDEAVQAASRLGWPVVLKTDAAGVAHKSDVGGVVLGLGDASVVGAAYDDLSTRLGPRVLVSATAPAGIELALGVVADPLFGPLVVVAAGGVLIEVLGDRAVGLPPLDDDAARRLLDRLAARPLLDGHRGTPPADVSSVVVAVSGLAQLALELGDVIQALDINPLVASAKGAVAVDVLVEPTSPA